MHSHPSSYAFVALTTCLLSACLDTPDREADPDTSLAPDATESPDTTPPDAAGPDTVTPDTAAPDLIGPPLPTDECSPWPQVSPLGLTPTRGVIAANADDDVLYLNDRFVWHWDGTNHIASPLSLADEAPAPCTTISWSDIWRSGTHWWATTYGGELWHGTTQGALSRTSLVEGRLIAISGTSPTDLWAVGDAGTLAHFDGTTWTTETLAANYVLTDVQAVGPDELWVTAITPNNSSGPARYSRLYRGIRSAEAWSWTIVLDNSGYLHSVWASSSTDVWVSGRFVNGNEQGTTLRHFDGTTWAEQAPPPTHELTQLTGFVGPDGTELWAYGTGTTLHHWKSGVWTPITGGLENSQVGAQSVAPLGNGVAWFMGGNHPARAGDGNAKGLLNACCHLFGMAVNDPSDLWFVGERALLMHFDGTRYHLDQSLTRLIDTDTLDVDRPIALYGTWRSPPIVDGRIDSAVTDHWAVGAKGMVWRRSARPGATPGNLQTSPWQSIPVPASAREARLLDVWGTSADQLWIVGLTGDVDHGPAFGVLLEWDGTRLFEPAITNRPDRLGGLRAVAGSGPDDVWAVGRGDQLYHFDGRSWSALPLGESLNLNHATSTGPGRILAGGAPDTYVSGAYFGLLVDVDLARPDPIRIHRLGADKPVFASWANGADPTSDSGALPPPSPTDPAAPLTAGVAFDSTPRPWLAVEDTWKPHDARWHNASVRSESRLVSDGKHLWLLGVDASAFKSPPIGTDLLTSPCVSAPHSMETYGDRSDRSGEPSRP